jgi:uncharacterized integral membrane protein (TIGR00697 family)
MQSNLTKSQLYQMLTGVFVACLLISNVLAAKTFTVGEIILPTGVIIFPLVYIVNDVLAEIYGFKKARDIILLGFVMNLLAVLAYSIAIALPAPAFATEGASAFAVTLGSTWRVLLASFAAYLIGSFVNAFVMVKMKERLKEKLMLRCITSTFIGEGLDAIIFITIVFIGTMPVSSLLIMTVAQATFKTVFEVVFYPLTRVIIKRINQLAD